MTDSVRAAAAPVRLYRCRTPTDRLCPCGRVARALRAQGLEVVQERVPWRKAHRTAVRALSGQERVPLVVIDGEVICDSHRIIEFLEARAPLSPAPAPAPASR